MRIGSTVKIPWLIASAAFVILSFQNCAPVSFSELDNVKLGSEVETPEPSTPISTPLKCLFNGQEYSEGQSVTAFLNSTVPMGQSCQSEERVCKDGVFSGSYAYATCQIDAPASCLFNGQTIAHNGQVTAYPVSSVPYGGSCVPQIRHCNNGTLSGSAAFATCSVGAAASCIFNNTTVAHQGVVRAFQTSSVAYGQTCAGQDRICNNGALSGTYAFASCVPAAPASCLFNGQTIAHGQAVTAYQRSNVSYGQVCASQQRTCNNGTLSGSYTATTCTVASCVANQGQACAKQERYYWESASFVSLDACEMYKGNAGFQSPCPAATAGWEWSGKLCRNDYAPTNGNWRAKMLCAEAQMGTVTCGGTCE